MTPAPLQSGAGALGVGAEQRRLHAVCLRERLADRVEQSGIRRRVAPSRAADRALVDRHHTRAGGDRPVHEQLLPEPATPVTTTSNRADVDVDVAQVVRRRAADLQRAGGRPHRLLEGARSSRWPPVRVPLARSPSTVPSKQTVPPAVPARGRGRRRGRRSRSSPARAPRRAPCCPCRAAAAASRSSAGCHGDAGPWWARRRRR